jgi:transcription-repair coupling factor (superfamily II helicase)
MTDTKGEFAIDARLPEGYVHEPSHRMEIYQRFGEAISLEEVEDIWAEIEDRFGSPPEPALWLYYLTRIRVQAAQEGVLLIKQEKLSLIIEKRKGKDTITRKILMPKMTSPQQLEQFVLSELKRT